MSGSKQTTTTSSEPYKPSQPLLERGLTDALKLYENGIGGQQFAGSTVIPYSLQTMKGMSGLEGLASRMGRGGGGGNLTAQMENIIRGGGFTGPQQQAMGGLEFGAQNAQNRYNRMLGNGGFNQTQQMALGSAKKNFGANQQVFQDLINSGGLTADQRTAMDNYRTTATSSFAPDSNPAFQKVLAGALDAAGDSVNLSAAGAGRYGSGAHQSVMGKTAGNLANTMYSDEYNRYLNRKDAANNSLFAGGQQGVGNMTGAYGTMQGASNNLMNMGQVGIDNIDRQFGNLLNAQGQLFNAGQAGIGNMRDAYSIAQMPYQTQMQVGGMNEDLATRLKNDELRLFNGTQNGAWDQIGRLLNVANLNGSYGSKTETAAGPNPFLQALGAGTGGLGFFSDLFGGGGAPAGTGGLGGRKI
ncbi:hypothetical protein J2Y63_002402 [Shinella sp. BE166]|uniref:hypothetical protein n=1 Tax=Shinella sp. BE166 TaxID=3373918 RepID=UPI003EB69D73